MATREQIDAAFTVHEAHGGGLNRAEVEAMLTAAEVTAELEALADGGPSGSAPVSTSTVILDKYAWACNVAGAGQEVLDKIAAAAGAVHEWQGLRPAKARS